MCGIAGIVRADGGIEEEEIVAMRDTLTHRGPDDAGCHLTADRRVALGHRRLSIIDLSSHGHQPMSNETGTIWIVYNGEVYNFPALRAELSAKHRFRSRTDTEVLLHAYEEWGIDFLERLRGMFAFALWDGRQRRLLLARDRLGIKPLYYGQIGASFLFASELKAITRCFPSLPLDESALYDFLTYLYIPTPKTPYRDVRKLPAGHYLLWEEGRTTLAPYWELTCRPSGITREEEAVEALEHLLDEAVRLRLVSDVPLGLLLSGGVDSSGVTALACRHLQGKGGKVHTFSVGFDDAAFTETPYARIVAERYGTEHVEQHVDLALGRQVYARLHAMYDEPFGDTSAIPTFLVSEVARRHVTVVLSGDGGDEVFGGYTRYREMLEASGPLPVGRLLGPAWRSRIIRGFLGHYPARWRGRYRFLRTLLDPLEAYCMLMGGILKEEKAFLLRPEIVRRFRDYDDYWFFREHWIADLDPFTRLQYLDLKTYLPDDILTKVDRASMAVSLEVRVPILDHEVVAFAFSLPVAVRNPGNRPKYLLKRMLAPFLPETILERRKQGFAIPLSRWAEGGMLEGSGGEIPFLQPRPPRGANRSEFALLLDALLRGWFAEHAPSSGG